MTEFQPSADELITNNSRYAAHFPARGLAGAPRRHLAVVTCMDARIDVFGMLGLENGEAHIIRNAGGVVTDDVVRSLTLSQRALGTREIILIHHTGCGLQTVTDDGFKAQLEEELGVKPAWAIEAFRDPVADVRQSMRRIHANPFIVHKDHVRGFVYDVDTGALTEVDLG